VNCGAIPDGTIDSELFGHEKGAYTGAHDSRKGYFEVADGGTIFLDEVAELPLSTQVRLLRVLETGEFLRVGSSKVQKTNVRVIAATNVNITDAINENKFREDLYYRLNTVPINIPPLRKRGSDVSLLFRKFASDFAERYRMPSVTLSEEAKNTLENYEWPGNVRQLKNLAEQISIIEQERSIDAEIIMRYLPDYSKSKLPALIKGSVDRETFSSEREILYKILFDMKNDMNDLKKLVHELMHDESSNAEIRKNNAQLIEKLYEEDDDPKPVNTHENFHYSRPSEEDILDTEEIIEESLSLEDKEIELIKKALEKHHGKRKHAAHELGISERTLYRKIKEYEIDA
jgi:transcriptional regulator with PAS, ATPase and Fis domain